MSSFQTAVNTSQQLQAINFTSSNSIQARTPKAWHSPAIQARLSPWLGADRTTLLPRAVSMVSSLLIESECKTAVRGSCILQVPKRQGSKVWLILLLLLALITQSMLWAWSVQQDSVSSRKSSWMVLKIQENWHIIIAHNWPFHQLIASFSAEPMTATVHQAQ